MTFFQQKSAIHRKYSRHCNKPNTLVLTIIFTIKRARCYLSNINPSRISFLAILFIFQLMHTAGSVYQLKITNTYIAKYANTTNTGGKKTRFSLLDGVGECNGVTFFEDI